MAVTALMLRGKTPEQKQVIKYFLDTGCFSVFTRMKDEAYDDMILRKLNALNLKEKALDKIGVDEDQLQEIPPVFLHGYNFEKDTVSRIGSDDRLRSSSYDATWLFFSENQVYIYSYTMDMTSDSKKEKTEEYFYKDITNFSTVSETIETIKLGCIGKDSKITREYSRFSIVVPGDRFYCSTSGVADAENSVNAMKQKLREKKA